ncbi:MAG: hypothetical protein EXS49_02165 [Candidatus Pacebacteria bacterium]|nr:hypothetical protein [Candidatus Paceibacterota bacterium]
MKWANFLHFYQPANQKPEILEAVTNQSYRKILDILKNSKRGKINLNISGSLLDLFDKYGYKDLFDRTKELVREGKIELVASAKYHAILPLLPEEEIKRQISENLKSLKYYLGEDIVIKGFFPPEMAWNDKLIPILESFNFSYVILDEIAYGVENKIDYRKIYKIKNSKLNVFFRERRASNLIMSAVVRDTSSFVEVMKGEVMSDRYLVTAMDGETFGHHRPGLERILEESFLDNNFELVGLSDLEKFYSEKEEVSLTESTWASSVQDIKKGIQFLTWLDPENIIHRLQWDFLNFVLKEFYSRDSSSISDIARNKLDIAVSSDQFFWASAKPWWSVEMIEYGAWLVIDALRSLPDLSEEGLNRARKFYEEIVSTAFDWQRSGKISTMMNNQNSILRIPFKNRTLELGGEERGVYFAFIDMMKREELKAKNLGQYEKAIVWRDAIYKLENKLDIYDGIHAVDFFRNEVSNPEVEKTILEYKKKYKDIKGGQPEQRGQ